MRRSAFERTGKARVSSLRSRYPSLVVSYLRYANASTKGTPRKRPTKGRARKRSEKRTSATRNLEEGRRPRERAPVEVRLETPESGHADRPRRALLAALVRGQARRLGVVPRNVVGGLVVEARVEQVHVLGEPEFLLPADRASSPGVSARASS
eukprot:3557448-Rhodomonas_salina.2